jgi:hypothetical protein
MKAYLWLPLACLVGYLIGSWGAQDELRAFRSHARDVKQNAAAKPGGFDAFAQMVKIPESARRSRRPRPNRPKAPLPSIAATNKVAVKQTPVSPSPAKEESDVVASTNAVPPRLSPEDLRARIEEAQDLWRTRVELARAQWKSKLKLEGEAEKAFDAALQEMNERLYDSVAALAGLLEGKESLTPELGLRLVGETTTILAETYDKIGACAAPGMREQVSTIQMVDFIDPGVAEPLIDVQGKLENFPAPRGRDR